MSAREGSTTNMSIQPVTSSTVSADEVNNTICISKSNEETMSMAEPSKLQESHGEDHVQAKIVGFCAFVIAKPKLSFGKCMQCICIGRGFGLNCIVIIW